jgi:hypothetical protein
VFFSHYLQYRNCLGIIRKILISASTRIFNFVETLNVTFTVESQSIGESFAYRRWFTAEIVKENLYRRCFIPFEGLQQSEENRGLFRGVRIYNWCWFYIGKEMKTEPCRSWFLNFVNCGATIPCDAVIPSIELQCRDKSMPFRWPQSVWKLPRLMLLLRYSRFS